jgi:hypothetical protein
LNMSEPMVWLAYGLEVKSACARTGFSLRLGDEKKPKPRIWLSQANLPSLKSTSFLKYFSQLKRGKWGTGRSNRSSKPSKGSFTCHFA